MAMLLIYHLSDLNHMYIFATSQQKNVAGSRSILIMILCGYLSFQGMPHLLNTTLLMHTNPLWWFLIDFRYIM